MTVSPLHPRLLERAMDVAQDITSMPGSRLIADHDEHGIYFQVECQRPDSETGEIGLGHGGKHYLTRDATDDQMVKIALGLMLRYFEHEVREAFRYQGVRLFGPHITIGALMSVAEEIG